MRILCLLFLFLVVSPANAQHGIRSLDSSSKRGEADSIRANTEVTLTPGLELSLWASEELVADPIALYIDDNGRAFYSRTNRQTNSEFDIRGHQDWMIQSISFKTVEDRRAFLREELSPENSDRNTWLNDLNGDGSHDWKDLLVEKEHIYKVEDRSGDGLADFSQLVVEDFHEEHTDVAGAVLFHEDNLFVGVGPDMWRMWDTDGDGVMDEKTSISHGYAIHIGFGAHGMSGLTVGPDGKIYWGIGDIGFYGTDQSGKLWDYSNQGVIVRSNPDGSDFEVYAAGLRNTHEFVFDEYGNIISEDNDGDHPGEKERIVYITNGSDTGWRTNWQFGKYIDPKNNAYKVWMDEEYFKPRFDGQAAHITPPITLYHSGPAGMKFNPGTALGDRWKNHFFVAEFVGNPSRSKVHAFQLKPKGASFELGDEHVVVQGVLTSGIAFGPDGALYLADWINGWGTKNEGRIWKLDVPGGADSAVRKEVQQLLASNLNAASRKELAALLEHEDMRVRQKAQFALARKGRKGMRTLRSVAQKSENQLARIHALWGLAQLARQQSKHGKHLIPFLNDEDPEIRAQAAKMLGDIRYQDAGENLLPLLSDSEARPKFFAAEALGRIAYQPAVQPIIAMLEANNDEDAYLRHAGALALARIGQVDPLLALENHSSRALRLAAVIALRRMQHPGVAVFLDDSDEYIATDAARAINDDASIEDALPALASVLSTTPFTNEPLLRRAINANARLGGPDEAQRLAAFARRTDINEALRVEAIHALSVWSEPSVLDRVDGTYRGQEQRDPAIASKVLAELAEPLLTDPQEGVRIAMINALGENKVTALKGRIEWVMENDTSTSVRIAALDALYMVEEGQIPVALQKALMDDNADVRLHALTLLPDQNMAGDEKVEILTNVYTGGTVAEQQNVLLALGDINTETSRSVLGSQIDSLASGSLHPATQLELIEAVEASGDPELQTRLDELQTTMPPHGESLEGGDAMRGRTVFYRSAAGQCTRCHNAGRGGGDVGPRLDTIGTQLTRQELLESLVDPSKRIAPGYGENISSMPPMGALLSPREIRDVVAFLESLK